MENTKRLPSDILGDIRENLGVEREETSQDTRINNMSPEELFESWCVWHNLLGGWGRTIKRAIDNIYGKAQAYDRQKPVYEELVKALTRLLHYDRPLSQGIKFAEQVLAKVEQLEKEMKSNV